MNKLQAYLNEKQISRQDFADLIGVTGVSVWRFCHGKATPGLATAVRIERETGGLVPASFWVADEVRDDILDHSIPQSGGVS